MGYRMLLLRCALRRQRMHFAFWLAARVPRRLRYYVTLTSIAEATTGRWANTVVPDLTAMEVLKRIDGGPA